MSQRIALSFVIPAYNEEDLITRTIEDIERHVPAALSHEIILVDNGSSDQTPLLARTAGAKVLIEPTASISELRNIGVAQARGKVVVFIDADISLTPSWRHNIIDAYEKVLKEKIIIGSKCQPVGDEGVLDQYWFRIISKDPSSSYVGTGHLIISKNNFLYLGGFDKNLSTGEDYDFCARARKQGYISVIVPELTVIHHGFPKTLLQFLRREAWHGTGDISSMRNFFTSKVAIVSLLFLITHIMLAISIIFQKGALSTALLAFIFFIPTCVSFYKFKDLNIKSRFINIALITIYLHGRNLSYIIRQTGWR